jgi:CHAD domain-containing protein
VPERSQLLRQHLDRLTRALRVVDDGDTRSLHRARIASRRLRELLPLLELQPDRAKKLGRRLRKVTRRLGTVRELDVLMLLIDERHVSRRRHSAALSRVGIAVSTERDQARKRLFARDPAGDLRRVVKRLGRVAGELQKQAPARGSGSRVWLWAVDARVAGRANRLRVAIDDAGTVYLPERLHVVRVALKKLRYALELATELGTARTAGRKSQPDLRVLKRAQDSLGRMHDLQTLIAHVREVQASVSPPNVTVWRELDVLVAALDDDCRRLHARYMRARSSLVAIAEKLSARRKGQAAAPQSVQRVG